MTSATQPKVFGTGLIALDLVIGPDPETPVRSWSGGTCGNVLSILAWLGWDAYPIARMNGDVASERVRADMTHWGVHLDWTTCAPTTDTPHHRPGNPAWTGWPAQAPVLLVVSELWQTATAFQGDYGQRGGEDQARARRCIGVLSRSPVARNPHTCRRGIRSRRCGGVRTIRQYDRQAHGGSDRTRAHHQVRRRSYSRHPRRNDRRLCGTARSADLWGARSEVSPSARPVVSPIGCISRPFLRRACGHLRLWRLVYAGLIAKAAVGGEKGLRRAGARGVHAALRYGQALAAWNCGFEGAPGRYVLRFPRSIGSQITSLLNGRFDGIIGTPSGSTATQGVVTCPACPSAPRKPRGPGIWSAASPLNVIPSSTSGDLVPSVDDAIEKTQAVIDQVQVAKRGLMQVLLTQDLPGRHTRFKQTEIGRYRKIRTSLMGGVRQTWAALHR